MEPAIGPALLAAIFCVAGPQEQPPGGPDPVRLLVGFAPSASPGRAELLEQLRMELRQGRGADRAQATVAALEKATSGTPDGFAAWLSARGGRLLRRFWIVDAAVIEISAEAMAAIAGLPEVSTVERDEPLSAHLRDATSAANHNADFVQVDLNLRGGGTTLALLDSGVNMDYLGSGRPHPAFDRTVAPGGTRVVHAEGVANSLDISDENGHGTAVAGVALAREWAASGMSDDGFAPRAELASYRITTGAGLDTSCEILIAAWQRVLADRASLNISVANCSYRGSPDPTSLAQQALDTLVWVGDVLVVTSAGNDGLLSQPTAFSQANVNGLSVGAVQAGVHAVAGFSTYGPPAGDGNRFFPDLVAVGSNVLSVPLDSVGVEARSGTSFATPMVAGTALLVRQARPDFDALDTKAVILNSLQDISAANPGLDRQHYGLGLLRSDLAVQSAMLGTLRGSLVAGSRQRQDFAVRVDAGQEYSATLVWARTQMHLRTWDDLDLLVLDDNGRVIAGSGSSRNVYERARFRARTGGTYTLVVGSGSLATGRADFAIAFGTNAGGGGEAGHYGSMGAGCAGTGSDPAAGVVLPPAAAATFGNARTRVPLAFHPTRLQQAFDASWFSAPLELSALAFRRDQDQGTAPGLQADIEVFIGHTDRPIDDLSVDFDDNPVAGSMVKVFADDAFDLPGIANAPGHPGQFDYLLPLQRPFAVDPAGPNLLLEIRVTGHSAGSEPVTNWFDAVSGVGLRRVYSVGDPDAGSGIPDDVNLVVSFVGRPSPPIEPRLTWEGSPRTGGPFAVVLRDALPGTLASLLFGRSIVRWGAEPLPFPLAALGAPGCSLYLDPILAVPITVGANGQARVAIEIPVHPALVGAVFYNQFCILDPSANTLGLAATNGGFGLIGR